ncbi:MAG: envelope biogenesis factor ElyC [Deltaproteobacteria bacterium CG07_land_8_20_14_0_80_60_11]|nr:MAG: envelope biogenesis factor ElyC [Deltaproteobacteria bacterium CG07_land_8_20_14_0_80_60_11]
MFMLKKIVPLLLYPVSLCLGILILGLFCLWATRRQRLGKVLVTLGTVLLLLLSLPFLSGQTLTPLERRYPALLHPETVSWGEKSSTSPKWIVVLGGGHRSDPGLPANSQISAAALGRVVEGVRLYKTIPGSKLLLSGGGVFDPVPEAEVMAQIAGLLGVKPQDISLESDSRDTADQAEIIAKKIGRERFILVTSAAHMPRSMALFRKRGLQPIPAPADFPAREPQGFDPSRFFPGAGGLGQVETALHEYLGLAWAWLRGEI